MNRGIDAAGPILAGERVLVDVLHGGGRHRPWRGPVLHILLLDRISESLDLKMGFLRSFLQFDLITFTLLSPLWYLESSKVTKGSLSGFDAKFWFP